MKPLKLWCCVGYGFKSPYHHYDTLSYRRRDSIKKLMQFSSGKTSEWKFWKSRGWRCVKVEVTIKEIK